MIPCWKEVIFATILPKESSKNIDLRPGYDCFCERIWWHHDFHRCPYRRQKGRQELSFHNFECICHSIGVCKGSFLLAILTILWPFYRSISHFPHTPSPQDKPDLFREKCRTQGWTQVSLLSNLIL